MYFVLYAAHDPLVGASPLLSTTGAYYIRPFLAGDDVLPAAEGDGDPLQALCGRYQVPPQIARRLS